VIIHGLFNCCGIANLLVKNDSHAVTRTWGTRVNTQQREQKYRNILKELNDLIIECDQNCQIVDAYGNLRITGRSEKQLIGCHISTLFKSQPIMDYLSNFSHAKRLAKRIFQARIERARGSVVHVAISVSTITGDTDTKTVLTIRDITNRMELAKKNRRMAQRMFQTEKLAYVGSLVQGMTHNLQGPLTSILGRAQLLALKHPDEPELHEITRAAQSMAENIRSLLVKVKGDQHTALQELNLNEIIKSELQVLDSNLFFKHQVQKNYLLDEKLPPVQGTYGDFSQSFANVIQNSLDAMRESSDKQILVATEHNESDIIVTVADTGTGIEKKNIAKIFEPHFTTKTVEIGSVKGDIAGMGLGLASVKDLLSPYDVKFELKSVIGKGTQFRFLIPYRKATQLTEEEMRTIVHLRIENLIETIDSLPTIPNILYEVVEVTASDIAMERLAQIVENDYSLSQKIFTIVNSAQYGLVNPITTLSQAVSYLGMQEIRDICFSLLSQQVLAFGKSQQFVGQIWSHALSTALISRQIMNQIGHEIPYGYLAALLHDVGQAILMNNFNFLMIDKNMPEPENLLTFQEEYSLFLLTHDIVGSYFLKQNTRLPEEMSMALENHHGTPDPQAHELTRLLILSDHMARDIEDKGMCSSTVMNLGKSLWGFQRQTIQDIEQTSIQVIEQVKQHYKI